MKKNYFFGAVALCGLLAFTSCGNDDDPILDGPGNEVATGEQVIVLDMQDTDVLSTKSRPLYSTDNRGSEDVTDVMLYIFKEETGTQKLIKTIHVDNWDNTCEEYKYGRKRTIKLEGKDKLEAGSTYTIYAVGQNETEVEGNPAPFKFQGAVTAPGQDNQWKNIPGLLLTEDEIKQNITHNFATTPGSGFPYLLTKPVKYDKDTKFASRAVGEVFSGQSKPVTLEPKESVSWTVLLKRQVAGVLGYFSNIPAEGNDLSDGITECWSTKLRLVASNRNDRLDMTIQLNKQNDDATEVGKENIVNGFSDSALGEDAEFKEGTDNAYTVYEIDLTKWFSFGNDGDWTGVAMDVDGKKYLGETSKWKNPYEGTNAAVTVADGAVLAGEFVIPFDKDETLNTFELQLVGKKKGNDQGKGFATDDNDKEYILQTWSVKLDDASIDATLKDTEYHYSIYRNHLYQIGKRGGGDDPDKPGVDPDKPQPLDKSQELVIKINDQWEFIHDLEID